ncbi:lysozyme inhibitor LprI family protein [Psychrobacillus psychrodurans]|uniref:Lysozyme inhibitor LprI family protein n=1 Tax=Psychrobacillus psychrodurans TaxID=126157 RepID=A0A9X3LAB2_9BACI|nr:lysozyme inhibitor LprI family protein [Psychrobacillus psychrodurans]MCZ8534281.1 lysozyme inhibitor LprI family protein [Psychrobacillus psychrodurans]
MKKLLVFLIPMVLLIGCNNEETEQTPETDQLGSETVTEKPSVDEENELEETTIVEEDKSNDIVKENKNTNEKPVVKEKPVTKEKTETVNLSGTKEKYLKQLNDIENSLSDLNNQYNSGTQTEMHEAKSEILRKWDNALNEIYGVLKKQLSANEMSSLKEEQRNWIKQRDQKAKEESSVFEGGTMEATIYVATQAQLTKERCFELVQKYMK